jgi:hypothetical protein
MVWQDLIIALANVLFGYSLVYQIWKGYVDKKGYLSLQTSFLTTTGLFALSISFFTLNLKVSSLVALFNGFLWLTLFIQGIIYKPNQNLYKPSKLQINKLNSP